MKFKNYNELKEIVRENCDSEELIRVDEEFKLFEERNWQKYIVLIANVLSDLKFSFSGGSALDSYVLYKTENLSNKNKGKLSCEKNKRILFNDALRLNIKFVYCNKPGLISLVSTLSNDLETYTSQLGLVLNERKIEVKGSEAAQIAVISDNKISEKEMEIILNEKKDSTEEENIVLRKYLVMRIVAFVGL